MTSIAQAVEVLNRIHQADPTVLPALIGHRVPCNEELADDPSVQVGVLESGYEVGILGVINGLIGANEQVGFIAAVYDDDGALTHFRGGVL